MLRDCISGEIGSKFTVPSGRSCRIDTHSGRDFGCANRRCGIGRPELHSQGRCSSLPDASHQLCHFHYLREAKGRSTCQEGTRSGFVSNRTGESRRQRSAGDPRLLCGSSQFDYRRRPSSIRSLGTETASRLTSISESIDRVAEKRGSRLDQLKRLAVEGLLNGHLPATAPLQRAKPDRSALCSVCLVLITP